MFWLYVWKYQEVEAYSAGRTVTIIGKGDIPFLPVGAWQSSGFERVDEHKWILTRRQAQKLALDLQRVLNSTKHKRKGGKKQ